MYNFTNTISLERSPSLDRYEDNVARKKSRVALRLSSLSSSTHALPTTINASPASCLFIPTPPGVPRRPDILVLPDSLSKRSSHPVTPHSPFLSVGPSRKRCRSSATLVPSATPTPGALPHDSIEGSMEVGSEEEDVDSDVMADIEVDIIAKAMEAIEFSVETDVRYKGDDKAEEEVESSAKSIVKAEIDRVIEPKIPDDILVPVTDKESRENFKIGSNDDHGDDHGNEGGNGNGNGNGDGNGNDNGDSKENGMGGVNGDVNPNMNAGDFVPIARECIYQDFLKCQPLSFKGTEGVVG
nr:hypothetical protein [Tanacetum cinerariifolium]